MQDAIAEILSVTGYTVAKDTDDMLPFQLLVKERRVSPSWRDRLDAQAEHRDETLAATYRSLGSQDQAMQLADRSDFGPPRAVGGASSSGRP